MGTNYYAHFDACVCCGRSETLHVGKSYRTLRAYPHTDAPIMSWSDWRAWFDAHTPAIRDEYGREVPIGEFVDTWERHAPRDGDERAARANDEWRSRFRTELGYFSDPEGYLLSVREFS